MWFQFPNEMGSDQILIWSWYLVLGLVSIRGLDWLHCCYTLSPLVTGPQFHSWLKHSAPNHIFLTLYTLNLKPCVRASLWTVHSSTPLVSTTPSTVIRISQQLHLKLSSIVIYKLPSWAWWSQQCNRYETWIGIVSHCPYFEPDTGINISFVGEKIHCLRFGFTNEKKVFVFSRFFFNTAKYVFGGISHLEQYRTLVSLSNKNTCVLSQESETTQIQYCWVFKFWDKTQYWVIHVLSCLCCTIGGLVVLIAWKVQACNSTIPFSIWQKVFTTTFESYIGLGLGSRFWFWVGPKTWLPTRLREFRSMGWLQKPLPLFRIPGPDPHKYTFNWLHEYKIDQTTTTPQVHCDW
jgi:hypothetical protein